MPENIKLNYRVIINHGNDSYFAPGAEFFLDEHGVQWVKFFPHNGYHVGKQHIIRTDQCFVIRDRQPDDN